MKTFTQIFWGLVAKDEAPQSPDELRDSLKRLPLRGRAHQVRSYLLAAAENRLPRKATGGWSLLFVLHWLRDHTGELYTGLAAVLLKAALQSNWPLENAVSYLGETPLAHYAAKIKAAQTPDPSQFQWKEAGPLLVAVTSSEQNLTKLAMKAGADVYLASSGRGSVIALRRGLQFVTVLPSGWTSVYPDLAIPRDEPVESILKQLPELVG